MTAENSGIPKSLDIFATEPLISHLNVERNVALGLVYRGTPRKTIRERTHQALAGVGLEARSRHYPSQLSGGQQQRVAIARAIVGRPDIILADEPTGNLDTENGNKVMDMLHKISAAGTTVIMVTHSAEQAKRAHRTVMMRDGKILS
ncbi:ATP-binding cassette domain-containing protein [Ochrobactrum sp. CM-21-5]|nr:ATP-binding cassette domain-containing protein [Ochrobactrum sp. CM-21-5]MBC2887454.1 ATP-binding cassette domain-containing protein [Ochrobactrum sp. CM-21-5]